MTVVDSALRFHHIGVACIDIRAEAARLALLGYAVEGDPFVDERQGVRGVFLGSQSPRLELLESLDDAGGGVLAPWLKDATKLYHLAYLARDFPTAIERIRAAQGKLVVAPVPAVAFGGREIAFLMLPNRLLIELIEEERAS
jgi:glyoxalase/bleomycin resistance protein/dioxygenase superfamily protein